MKNFLGNTWTTVKKGAGRAGAFIKGHKIVSVVVALILVGGGYWGYTVYAASAGTTEYVLGRATQGPLNVTVTSSGQVSAQDDLNLTPQASGQIVKIYVKPGQAVKAGTIVAELDMTTAAQSVQDAKENLESANISYQQTLTTSNTGVANDQTSVQTAQTSAANGISTTFTNIAPIMSGLDTNLHSLSTINGYTAMQNIDAYESFINTSQSHQYHDTVVADYNAAVASYQKTEQEYAAADLNSLDVEQTESLSSDTLQTLQAINTTLKDTLTYYNYVNQQIQQGKIVVPTQVASQISTVTGYQSTVTGDISSLNSANTSLVNAEQSLQKDTQTLNASATSVPLDVQSAQLNVQKAQEALDEAETNESNYIVRAPFDGTIATVPVNTYDQASSGTTIATLITNEEYADLSLNETDAAKVKVGQAATMTFDALPNVTMAGSVAQVDPIGTVSQGVVTYDVKVGFSQQNDSIKPGMTVQATITTASSTNAIQVPSAAVHTAGTSSYVEVAVLKNASSTMAALPGAPGSTTGRRMRSATSTGAYAGMGGTTGGGYGAASSMRGFGANASSTVTLTSGFGAAARSMTVPADEVTITRVPVVTGLSNDTSTEITSGLRPGQLVVTATQSTAKTTTKSSAASATSLLGGSASGRTGTGGGFTGGTGSGFTGARATGGATAGAGRGG